MTKVILFIIYLSPSGPAASTVPPLGLDPQFVAASRSLPTALVAAPS